jgi:tetratricopeptide (TPR) repeat protein
LKNNEFNEVADEYLFNDSLFEEVIMSSSIWGFTHPYQVITEIGKTIAFHDPKRFISIMKLFPEPSEEDANSYMLFYSGQLYKELGKSYVQVEGKTSDNASRAFDTSRIFYGKISTSNQYHLIQISELYIQIGILDIALDTLEKVPIRERSTCFWHHRYSQILYGKLKYEPALTEIDEALRLTKESEEKYKSAFLFQKGKVLAKFRDYVGAIVTLREAFRLSDDKKFKSLIEQEIACLSATDPC